MDALCANACLCYPLKPLSAPQARSYIQHRPAGAQWHGQPAWEEAPYALICTYAGGIPRSIDRVCDRLLLCGTPEGLPTLNISC